jgi:hypothetical protein
MLHLFHPRLPADLKCLQSTQPGTASKFPRISDYMGEKKGLQKAVHQTIMAAKLEVATKRKLKADDLQAVVQYAPDDMVTVWRPVISAGKTKSARSSKLLYQNIGPFQVMEAIDRSSAGTSNEPPLTYRLRHVSTGRVNTYSVRHMFPFMRGTKHSQVSEAQVEEWAPIVHDGDLGLILRDASEVLPGMYLWMKPREGSLGYLTLITAVDARSDLIEAQLLNTTSDKRVGQWQQVWFDDHPDPKKRQPRPVSVGDEWNEYRTPVSCNHSTQYKPWVETAAFDHFTPISLDLSPDAQGYLRLPSKFHNKYVLRKPNPRATEPKAAHRDLSWYVDTTIDSPLKGDPAEEIKVVAAPGGHVSMGRQTRRSTRTACNTATTNRLQGTTEDHAYMAVDETLLAVVRWIRTRTESEANVTRLEGAEHFEYQFPHVKPVDESTTAGNCKGHRTRRLPRATAVPGGAGGTGRDGRRARLARAITQSRHPVPGRNSGPN